MGREVRRVPKDWQHPKDGRGRFVPLHEGRKYASRVASWEQSVAKRGLQGAIDYEGGPPDRDDYMPSWSPEESTHLMMYENTSEGTPISPAFETPEELARWLVDNNASAVGGMGATYEGWLRVAQGGWAPSAVGTPGVGMMSGVDAFTVKAAQK